MMSSCKEECPTHYKVLESFCKSCNTSACTDCEHLISCYKNTHDVIPMRIAIDAFNQEADEIIKVVKDIKQKLEDTFHSIFAEKSDFESHLKVCRTAIETQTKTVIEKVQKKSDELMLDLENIYKQKNEVIENQVKELDSKQMQVQNMTAAVTKLMNKPEETEMLASHKTRINAVRRKVLEVGFNKSSYLTPTFMPCTHLDEVIHMEGIGKIGSAEDMYVVDEDDATITVTEGQPFDVKVSRIAEGDAKDTGDTYQLATTPRNSSGDKDDATSTATKGQSFDAKISSITTSDTCLLAAALMNSSGEEYTTEIADQGNGEYRITGRCNEEGDWLMKITDLVVHIKGSPVNVKVEKLGLVQTIDNDAVYKESDKIKQVVDVVLGTDACILVSCDSNYILKFNQSGSFIARIQMPNDGWNDYRICDRMHLLGNGHMVYSDIRAKCVIMCDDKCKDIRSFGKDKLKFPVGLTVNKDSRIMYVADRDNHCVFKFNVDDGRLLGKIDSNGSGGQMKQPCDVTLTNDGHLIVADYENHRIQMFDDANNTKLLVDSGDEDGKVLYPRSVAIDIYGNLIVSSNHKIQLFDTNGVFMKRIDHKGDGINRPAGLCLISSRPRRVAVANNKANNIKIFNY